MSLAHFYQDVTSFLCSARESTQAKPGAPTGSSHKYRRVPSTLSRLRITPPQSYILAAVAVLRGSLFVSCNVSVTIGQLLSSRLESSPLAGPDRKSFAYSTAHGNQQETSVRSGQDGMNGDRQLSIGPECYHRLCYASHDTRGRERRPAVRRT